MKFLNKKQIIDADDLKSEIVDVPEWCGCVKVRTITGTERDAFEQSIIEYKGKSARTNLNNLRAKLCQLCMTDEKGAQLFTLQDLVSLGKKSAKALDRVFGVAQTLNGFSDEDIEGLTKNSDPDQSDDSTSA